MSVGRYGNFYLYLYLLQHALKTFYLSHHYKFLNNCPLYLFHTIHEAIDSRTSVFLRTPLSRRPPGDCPLKQKAV